MLDWLPILVMLVVAVGFALASLGASYILSPKKATPEKLAPYECGIFPEVEPSQRFPVKFYMVAMLYICLLYTSPSPRDGTSSRMPSSA